MSGHQFFHIESYAREESTKQQTRTRKNSDGSFSSQEVKKKKSGSVSSILAETDREEGNCPHVENPEPPTIWLGNLQQVQEEATAWAEQSKDAQGRKLRKDAHCLLAGVISFPRSNEEDWPKFREASIQWLKKKYGENLRCVAEHTDESHPHIHFYVVAKIGQSFDDLHEGKRAQKELKKQNPEATKKEQNIAFAEAMRATQDDFSKSVAQRFGLTRLGPGRRRLSRAQWKAEQKQAEALRTVEATAKKRHEHYKQQGLEAGKQQAQAEAQKLGAKVGAVVDGFKGSWHKPSQRVKTQAEAIKQQAKAYADRTKKDAERAVQDEKNRRRNLEAELEKKTYMVTNLEADNKRLLRELEGYRSTASNKQSNKLKR